MESKLTKLVVLTLTKEEADWLHNVMQNPLWNQNPDEESPEDAEMRRNFFEATYTN